MMLATQRDIEAEKAVAEQLECLWGCRFHHYGPFDAVDWWVEKSGRCSAVAELKRRYREHDAYRTVFINLRKWLALTLAASVWGVAGLYIVAFDDGIWYIDVGDVQSPFRLVVKGREDRSRDDREPTIEIPIEAMIKAIERKV